MSFLSKVKKVFIFPVAFVYVMLYLLWFFLKFFLEGHHTEYILQILFVKMQNRLDRLIYRATWFTPLVYLLIILKVLWCLYFKN